MANNFELVLANGQSIVSGDAEAFCAGTGAIRLARTDFNNGLQLKGSIWDKVATIKWDESIPTSSNIGYEDSEGNWYPLSPSLSWSGSRLTMTNLNMPAGDLLFWAGQDSESDIIYGNLEILDADGNSLLEATEPSTGLPLYIGDSNIQAVKLGDVDISKMYIGDTLIYGTDKVVQYNWDFDIVGNLTEADGVYSGFSANNYLISKSSLPSSLNSFELVLSFTTGASIGYESILGGTEFSTAPVTVELSSDGTIAIMITNNGSWETLHKAGIINTPNNDYILKANVIDNIFSASVIDLSTGTENAIGSSAVANPSLKAYQLTVGRPDLGTFAGSINTRDSYIKVNGQLITDITEI